MILTVLHTVCLLFGTPYQTMCLFSAGPGNFIILYPVPNTACLVSISSNEWRQDYLTLPEFFTQPTPDYLLSTAELSKTKRESTSHAPLQGWRPDSPSCWESCWRKGSCFVQCYPLSHDGLHLVREGIKPWPQFPKCRQCWGIFPASELLSVSAEVMKTTLQPNAASFFPFLRG